MWPSVAGDRWYWPGPSIPIILGGAILGVPTLGLGFIGMNAGIVLTALSGAMMIVGIVKTAISCKHHPIKPEPAAF